MDLVITYLIVAFIWACLFGILYGTIETRDEELYPHEELNIGSVQYVVATGMLWPLSLPVTLFLIVNSFIKENDD